MVSCITSELLRCLLALSDGHLNLDSRVDVDGGDLTHDVGRRLQVDQTLVDAHLEAVPSVGTLTARRLTGGDTKSLGWQTDRSGVNQLLLLSSTDEISADLLEGLDLTGGQSDANAVNLLGRKKGKEERCEWWFEWNGMK